MAFGAPAAVAGACRESLCRYYPVRYLAGCFCPRLALIPIGAFRRGARFEHQSIMRLWTGKLSLRRLGVFLIVATIVNVIIGTQLTYRAVEHMETVQFCGNTCHVMKPEFAAHPARRPCQDCLCRVSCRARSWWVGRK